MSDLCLLSDVKDWLNISDSSQDDLLSRLITSTSNDFLSRIRRPGFYPSAAHTETLEISSPQNDSNMEDVFLRHYPITAITSVTVNGIVLAAFDETNPAVPGYFFDENLDSEERDKITLMGFNPNMFGTWSSPWRSIYRPPLSRVIVVYQAGYAVVPADAQQAIIEWIGFKRGLAQLQSKDQSGQSLYIGSYRQDTMVAQNARLASSIDMPESVSSVIEIYQRSVI